MSRAPLMVLPAAPSGFERPFRIGAGEYRNRSDLFESLHIEARASADRGLEFLAETVSGADGDRPHLACRVAEAGDYFRLCASFPMGPLVLGDLVHLQWVARARPLLPDDEEDQVRGVEELLLACDGSRRGKQAADRLALGDDLSDWTRAEALLQVVKASAEGLLHLTFLTPSDTRVDIAGVRVVVCGRAAPGSATMLDPAIGQARLFRPLERAPLGPEEPLFRSSDALGFVQRLSPDRVRGWAMDAGGGPVRLELRVDDRSAGTVTAPGLKAGVEGLDFEAPLGPELLDGAEHIVELRFPDGERLRGSPGRVRMTHRLEGLVEYDPASASLVGWAVDMLDPDRPATVELLADGEPIGAVLADQPHQVLTSPAYRRGLCAFRFPLPESVGRQEEQVLSARLGGTALELPGGLIPLRRAGPRHVWGLEADGAADRVRGWVADLLRPGEPVWLKVEVDGLGYGEVVADQPLGQAGRMGFSCPVPFGARTLALAAAATGERLAVLDLRAGGAGPEAGSAGEGDVEAAARAVDADWYLAAYPRAAEAVAGGGAADAADHWRRFGAATGFSPTPWFDEAWYRREHPDVAEAAAAGGLHSGFAHYLARGAAEGRRPGPGVDPALLARRGETLGGWLFAARPAPATPAAADARPRTQAPHRVSHADERDDLRAALAPREKGALTVFDGLVATLLRDIGLVDRRRAAGLREQLARSETEIMRWLWANPLPPAGEGPLVSVVMPTFNRAFVIAEAIESVREQSWTNWELLVCDDGSTDRTRMVVQGFDDPRVRYLKLEKANGASARNHGLRFARGEYLAFLDSDNVWHPNFLALGLGALLRRRGVELLYSGFIDTQISGARYSEGTLTFRAFDYAQLSNRNYIDLNTLFLRRSLYEDLGGFDADLPRVQDWDLILKYAQFAEPLAIQAYPAFYRRNVAWGQVTDLYAHMNFTQLVRERAAERLAAGQPPLRRGLVRRAGLSVAAGPSIADVSDALGLALAAGDVADLRVFLPDTPDARALADLSRVAGVADLIWRAADEETRGLRGRLWGEALIVADAAGGLDPDALAGGAPCGRLIRRDDAVSLRLGLDGEDEALLGGLPPLDPDRLADPLAGSAEEAQAAPGLTTVIVDEVQRQPWNAALASQSRRGGAALLIALGPTVTSDRFVLHRAGQGQVETLERALGLLRHHTAALVLAAPAPRPPAGSLYVPTAMSGSAVVFALEPRGSSTPPGRWAPRPIEAGPPTQVLAAVAEAMEQPGVTRTGAANLARYRRLHRPSVVRERLRHLLARWLEPARGGARRP